MLWWKFGPLAPSSVIVLHISMYSKHGESSQIMMEPRLTTAFLGAVLWWGWGQGGTPANSSSSFLITRLLQTHQTLQEMAPLSQHLSICFPVGGWVERLASLHFVYKRTVTDSLKFAMVLERLRYFCLLLLLSLTFFNSWLNWSGSTQIIPVRCSHHLWARSKPIRCYSWSNPLRAVPDLTWMTLILPTVLPNSSDNNILCLWPNTTGKSWR